MNVAQMKCTWYCLPSSAHGKFSWMKLVSKLRPAHQRVLKQRWWLDDSCLLVFSKRWQTYLSPKFVWGEIRPVVSDTNASENPNIWFACRSDIFTCRWLSELGRSNGWLEARADSSLEVCNSFWCGDSVLAYQFISTSGKRSCVAYGNCSMNAVVWPKILDVSAYGLLIILKWWWRVCVGWDVPVQLLEDDKKHLCALMPFGRDEVWVMWSIGKVMSLGDNKWRCLDDHMISADADGNLGGVDHEWIWSLHWAKCLVIA